MRVSTFRAPCIPGLLDPVMEIINPVTAEVRTVKAHKRQRATAVAVHNLKRDEDKKKAAAGQETREAQVLRCMDAYWNRFQRRPTALELMRWMKNKGERVFDVNSIRPRITKLVSQRLVESKGKRPCRVSGQTVCTWGARER